MRPLRIESLEQIEELGRKYLTLEKAQDTWETFLEYLTTRRDAWFIEVGDQGVVYLTDIVPGHTATLHLVFWDTKLHKERRSLIEVILATAFKRFGLRRIAAGTTSPALSERLQRLGFVHEGTLRQASATELDIFVLGILKDEVPCHVMPLPLISLG